VRIPLVALCGADPLRRFRGTRVFTAFYFRDFFGRIVKGFASLLLKLPVAVPGQPTEDCDGQ
jgi:hypothetical protein